MLKKPFDAIVFDCDGTLTKLEGIDELARYNQVLEPVSELTKKAMEHGALTLNLYEERLKIVRPTKKNLEKLSQEYIANVSQNAKEVISLFQRLGKAVYVVSAGMSQGVEPFAAWLGIPKSYVFSVSLKFNEDGQYVDFDRQSPLVQNDGKCHIIERIKKTYPRILLMGDGMNDLATKPFIERFVGYGGAFPRPKMEKEEPFYIGVDDFMDLLPFSLTQEEMRLC